LQALHPHQKLLILWDGASYHDCQEVQNYLDEINRELQEKDWKVTCVRFAPHAPAQNPVEDVWLKGKNFLRKSFYKNKTFAQVKSRFFNFLNKGIFDFEKIGWYLKIPQSV
jgi:transposase